MFAVGQFSHYLDWQRNKIPADDRIPLRVDIGSRNVFDYTNVSQSPLHCDGTNL